ADSARSKTNEEGFGLGLSIAKMITDLHGGNIIVTSRVGHGTTATVTLPITASAGPAPVAPVAP
ncbi:MAG TPA: ATP-binding protein, partial [Candidatus Saccharimonadales bacterium]|nr:ATP-binding protein [Candidatus Saccharimonadales bacterium]